jgi:thymidylate synthase (FAD)
MEYQIEENVDVIDVLNEGFIRLDAAMADDLSVINAARVSFGTRKEAMDERDEGLIGFLMRERHGTPFEHNAFRFHVRCPIFVMREWIRHRIGSFNELSGRYAKMDEAYYVPAVDDVRTQVGKPGSYTFERVDEEMAQRTINMIEASCRMSYEAYDAMLDNGIARELARTVLPVGVMTEFYWTVNARSLMNFLSLRNQQHAQREIRRYAEAVETMFEKQMPTTHAAFTNHGRVAP